MSASWIACAARLPALAARITVAAPVTPLFSREELRTLSADAKKAWPVEQARRLSDVVEHLNEAPLGVRLNKALADDRFRLSASETRLLRQFRDMRNDLVHGRRRPEPPGDDLQKALALVGRMLIFRLVRVGAAPSPPAQAQSDGAP